MNVFKIEGAKNTFVLLSFLGTNPEETEKLTAIYKNYQKDLLSSDFVKKICQEVFASGVDGCIILLPETKSQARLQSESQTKSQTQPQTKVQKGSPAGLQSESQSKFEVKSQVKPQVKSKLPPELDFRWEFFNCDGSRAEMCGNAARAVAWWYHQNIQAQKEILFQAHEILVRAEILASEDVKVSMPKVEFLGQTQAGHYLFNSGVPHLILPMPEGSEFTSSQSIDLKKAAPWAQKAKALRFPTELGSKGANVTLVWEKFSEKKRSQDIKAVSFERGVENWTLACGTGAMAAAYYAKEKLGQSFPIEVSMPGGDLVIAETSQGSTLQGEALVSDFKPFDLAGFLGK